MLTSTTAYLVCLVSFVIDLVGLIMTPRLGDIAITGVNLPPAMLFTCSTRWGW
jgi:hypothetical protein